MILMKKHIIALLFILAMGLTSCIPHKELLILNDVPKNADETDFITNQVDLRIQPEDLLSITVSSYNLEASRPFNNGNDPQVLAQAMQGTNYVAEMLTGYFVDADGFIDFPVIGRINVNKKTLGEVKETLYAELKNYLKDPVVNIRLLNFKVSVLGEVKLPGMIRLTNKRLTVIEAIAMAGDLTPYSNRTNVMIIREKGGKRSIKRLNLQSSSCLMSPYYYLQQNDVVYVEPNKTKVNTIADKSSRILAYVSTGISVLTIALYVALRP